MNYNDVIQKLEHSKKIIVTGPQRSGTTFAAYAIANDLKLKFFKETTFDNENIVKFRHIIYTENEFVLQCPAMVDRLPELASYHDLEIIVINRNIDDIIKSQARIGWEWEQTEKDKFLPFHMEINLEQPISQIKYDFIQKCELIHGERITYLDYESMKNHPLWINSNDRTTRERMHEDKETDTPQCK